MYPSSLRFNANAYASVKLIGSNVELHANSFQFGFTLYKEMEARRDPYLTNHSPSVANIRNPFCQLQE